MEKGSAFPEHDMVIVDRVLCSDDKSNYPLEEDEFEVPVKGRTGGKRARASAHLQHGGRIRIEDGANPEFWAELTLPEEYIAACYRYNCKMDEERQKRKKLYLQLKEEFENE